MYHSAVVVRAEEVERKYLGARFRGLVLRSMSEGRATAGEECSRVAGASIEERARVVGKLCGEDEAAEEDPIQKLVLKTIAIVSI